MTQQTTTQADGLRFDDTQTAFAYKSDVELRKARFLFGMLKYMPVLSALLSKVGMRFLQWRVPLVRYSIKKVFFEHFCGGESLKQAEPSIARLERFGVQTVLDYGVEVKHKETDFDATRQEFLDAVHFAGSNKGVPIVSVKVTGLGQFKLFERYSIDPNQLSEEEKAAFERTYERLASICKLAKEKKVAIFVDAEESWIQPALDALVIRLSKVFNTEAVVVYNTFQMYLKSSTQRLEAQHKQAIEGGFLLGAKLVRGAYIDKERSRAAHLGLEDPIHPTKSATDHAFDQAIVYCVQAIEQIAVCVASHNAQSNALLLKLLTERDLQQHPHVSFCQLYGMSDHLSFNLAKEGVRVMKYMPYGSVEDVFPYLARRAEENSSVTEDAGREYQLVAEECKRRGI